MSSDSKDVTLTSGLVSVVGRGSPGGEAKARGMAWEDQPLTVCSDPLCSMLPWQNQARSAMAPCLRARQLWTKTSTNCELKQTSLL